MISKQMISSQPIKIGSFQRLKFEQVKKFDVIYLEAYRDKAFGFIDWIDEDALSLKMGFGRKTNFIAWKKDKPKLYKLLEVNPLLHNKPKVKQAEKPKVYIL